MREDPNSMAQRGIELSACSSNAATWGRLVITDNSVSSVGANTLTNSYASLIYCGGNMGPGLQSPSVTCNDVSYSYHGFVFEGPNQGTMWRGNQMTELARGMMLSNGGEIGAQGGPGLGMGNTWTEGTGFFNGSYYGTYCFQSTASLSPLYRASPSGISSPPNNSGSPFPFSYGNIGISTTTNGASYNCASPNAKGANPSIQIALNYSDDGLFYIAQTAVYRFLHDNDSILNSDVAYTNFYGDLAGSSIDIFMQVETALGNSDLVSAEYLKSSVTSTNSVEDYYINYYDLFLSYAGNNFEATDNSDAANLISLASRCPGTDGACVYQARALYNSVFNTSQSYPVCSGSGARIGNAVKNENKWEIILYPNPTQNIVSFQSNWENANVNVKICDLNGRLLLIKDLQLNGFIAKLDLNLINGVYLVTLTNSNNEKLVKKLLINR